MDDASAASMASKAREYAEKHGLMHLVAELQRGILLSKPEPMDSIADWLIKDINKLRSLAPGEEVEREGSGDTEEAAQAYLEKYRIPQLMEELLGRVLYSQPEDPHALMIEELEKLQRRVAGARPPGFFSDDDLRGVFTLFDPTGKGKISEKQVITGFQALGINVEAGSGGGDAGRGAGAGEGKEADEPSSEPTVDEAEWVRRARQELSQHSVL